MSAHYYVPLPSPCGMVGLREVGRVGCERCGGAAPQEEWPNTPDPTNEWLTKR